MMAFDGVTWWNGASLSLEDTEGRRAPFAAHASSRMQARGFLFLYLVILYIE